MVILSLNKKVRIRPSVQNSYIFFKLFFISCGTFYRIDESYVYKDQDTDRIKVCIYLEIEVKKKNNRFSSKMYHICDIPKNDQKL